MSRPDRAAVKSTSGRAAPSFLVLAKRRRAAAARADRAETGPLNNQYADAKSAYSFSGNDRITK